MSKFVIVFSNDIFVLFDLYSLRIDLFFVVIPLFFNCFKIVLKLNFVHSQSTL